jgi:hypothetical protein
MYTCKTQHLFRTTFSIKFVKAMLEVLTANDDVRKFDNG